MTNRKSRGFGLIEILVTLGVLSVGVLGVVALQGVITRQSIDNKARAEAISIAQSRIEAMRNYTGDVSTLAEFQSRYAVTSGFANASTITGVNASFTRTERIVANGNARNIMVNVAWTDPDGDAESVSLGTELSYVSPRSAGDVALEAAPEMVDAPTGRARLGDGTLPDGQETVSNDDTTTYFDDGTDRRLVDGTDIVLTLTNACQTEEGTCLDFVKIKGTIYIDNASQNNLDPGDVFVVASDAAFCARYYIDPVTNQAVKVTANTTSTLDTPNGDYTYFNYTCYLGGGWHGNVGIILAGGTAQNDKFCVGDPVSSNAWEQPIIASRRVYRGMIYKYDDSNASGKEEVSDGYGGTLIRYYSQGIADSIEFPVGGERSHDFVVGSMSPGLTAGSNCISQGLMTRTDSNVNGDVGDLFEDVPVDFICLNDGYLDNYDTDVFGNASTCPYDPSDPPSTRHEITGGISVQAPLTAANTTAMSSVNAYTSDGPGNCLVSSWSHDGTRYQFTYACDVYDWGNGWNGYLQVIYNESTISCTPNKITKSNITADNSSGNNFTGCTIGSYAVFSGTVSAAGQRRLSAASMTDGACTVAADGLSYQCISTDLSLLTPATYTGTLSFTPTGGVVCSNPFAKSGMVGGFYTQNLVIANNSNGC
jgi:Tfp pilus assembly protein PilV